MTQENANHPQQQKSEEVPQQDGGKRCRYCGTLMPATASVCYQCKQNQKWWKNSFRIDHIGLLVALIMMVISYQQLQEAHQERISAKEAMERADQAKRAAAGMAQDMKNIALETRRIFEKLQKASDEIHREFSKVKEDTAAFKTDISDSKAEIKILKERLKKSYEEALTVVASVKTTFEAYILHVPVEVAVVYVFLQKPGTLEDGSSELLGRVSHKEFIKKFEEYIKIAKGRQMKLIVRASTADGKQWLQNKIKYKDKFLMKATFREPSQNKIIEGAEVPLN